MRRIVMHGDKQDLEVALKMLNLSEGHTVDLESNVYAPDGKLLGFIRPKNWTHFRIEYTPSKEPVLDIEHINQTDIIRWHARYAKKRTLFNAT